MRWNRAHKKGVGKTTMMNLPIDSWTLSFWWEMRHQKNCRCDKRTTTSLLLEVKISNFKIESETGSESQITIAVFISAINHPFSFLSHPVTQLQKDNKYLFAPHLFVSMKNEDRTRKLAGRALEKADTGLYLSPWYPMENKTKWTIPFRLEVRGQVAIVSKAFRKSAVWNYPLYPEFPPPLKVDSSNRTSVVQ